MAVVVARLQEDALVVDCCKQQRRVVDESRNPMVVLEPMVLVEVRTSECRSGLGVPVLENEAGWRQ